MADEIQNAEAPADVCPKSDDAPPILTPIAAQFDRTDCWSFAITTALAFAVNWFTLAPNVTLEDSGIFSVGAMYGGVPSPPGYPVWTIYSWLFVKLLPFSNIAWRVAVGSAVASALACGLVAMMVSHSGRILFDGTPAFSRLTLREQNLLRDVCGYVAGLVLGCSGTVWDQAVIVEIRGLSLLLFVGVLCFLMCWFFEPSRKRFLYGAFFLFGMLLTNSQELIVALPGLVCAVMLADAKIGRDVSLFVVPLTTLATALNQYGVWITFPAKLNWPMLAAFLAMVLIGVALAVKTRRVGTEWKCALPCGLCLLLGLAFYFYPPIASMTNPPVNWSYPRTAEGFIHMVSRGQFNKVYPTEDFGTFANQLWWFAQMIGKQFGWPYLVFAVLPIAFVQQFRPNGRRWLLALLAILLCVGLLLLAMLNPPPDRQAHELIELYFASSHVILAVWLGLGLMMTGARMARPVEKTSP